eukprot:7293432-Pyramimonas_sp.AAC.1
MTTASRVSSEQHLALQFLVRNYFRIENVVTVRLAKGIHGLPAAPYADSCTLASNDNDVTPGFQYYDSEGTALNMHDIIGSTHARTIQCLIASDNPAGFDEDPSKFEELADTPAHGGNAQEEEQPLAPVALDGRRSTIKE